MNIKSLYINLRKNGVVASQYEFSELCGRKNTWFSSVKCRKRPITIGALYLLAHNLAQRAKAYPQHQIDCALASAQVQQHLQQRARATE
jgi:hypothetical protein